MEPRNPLDAHDMPSCAFFFSPHTHTHTPPPPPPPSPPHPHPRYHPYNQTEKTAEIQHFIDDDLGLDVASLDRDWRELGLPQEGEYLVNTTLFPDMDGFFDYVHKHSLKVFFNDHPKPLDVNTSGSGSSNADIVLSPAEIEFRWKGMTSLMERGLDFWWYDCHWAWEEPGLDIPNAGTVDANTWSV